MVGKIAVDIVFPGGLYLIDGGDGSHTPQIVIVLDDTLLILTSDHGDCLSDHGQSPKACMYDVITRVPLVIRTPMGGRLLRKWLGQPLLRLDELVRRQDAIDWFVENTLARRHVKAVLTGEGAD